MNWMDVWSYSLNRLTIAIVISFVVLAHGLQPGSNALGAQEVVPTSKDTQQPSRIKFKALRISNGQTPDGIWFSLTKFEAEDGSLATKLVIPFDTSARADQELRRSVKLATKVVHASSQVDEKGKVIGQRVLALYPVADPDLPIVKLSWTMGSTYVEVSSNSMANVLELEKLSDASAEGQNDNR
jgi:hypothetical protein